MANNKWFVIALLSIISSTASRADETNVVQSASPVVHKYEGHATDVLGISTGMSLEDARRRIVAEYGADPIETKTKLSIQYRSIPMNTQEFVSQLQANKGRDSITVYLGTPATGGAVVGITRNVQYDDPVTAPLIDSVFGQLDEKYGKESTPSRFGNGLIRTVWIFGPDTELSCQQWSCGDASPSLDPGSLQAYTYVLSQGKQFRIMADVFPAQQDHTRVNQLTITVDDVASKALTLKEALKQLQAAAEAAYAKNATPQRGPKL